LKVCILCQHTMLQHNVLWPVFGLRLQQDT